MARVKGAMMTRKHRKKILGLAKGYWGSPRLRFMTPLRSPLCASRRRLP